MNRRSVFMMTALLAFNLSAQPPAPDQTPTGETTHQSKPDSTASELEAFKKAKHPPTQSGGPVPQRTSDQAFKKGQKNEQEPEQ